MNTLINLKKAILCWMVVAILFLVNPNIIQKNKANKGTTQASTVD